MRQTFSRYLLAIMVCVASAPDGVADDWPMWRYDANRSASSNEQLPKNLKLLWSRKFTPRKQAWDDPLNLDLMTYDRVFEPIVADGRMFVGFNDQDKLIAIDTRTGKMLWTAFAEAPIRFAPVAHAGNVYCTSDDGFLYCWSQADGSVKWRFRGGPSDQKALGNQRLTSAWPARGGPVVKDGSVYFAASIWPFMGTFIYSLDAETGEVQWVNDSTGSQYIKQPHSAPSFAGVAPQGCLVATEKHLIVPGGRSVPAVFDRATGKLRYFEINAGGKGTGGASVFATDDQFFVHTRLKGTRAFTTATGKKTAFMTSEPVLTADVAYSANVVKKRKVVQALRLDLPRKRKATKNDNPRLIWEVEADGTGDLIRVGDELFAGGENGITRIGSLGVQRPKVTATITTEFTPERLLAANGVLFAVGLDGTIAAFANHAGEPTEHIEVQAVRNSGPVNVPGDIVKTLTAARDASGFALWFGVDEEFEFAIMDELSDSFVQLAVIDSDAAQIQELRTRFDARKLYGKVTGHTSRLEHFKAPPYVANMVFVGYSQSELVARNEPLARELFRSVRPYGGVMQLLVDEEQMTELAALVKALKLPQAEISTTPETIVITKVGPIPGSDDWTHQYGNIANTVKSNDASVKLPLGVLWFGGSSNLDVLPRHGHGPPEQVVGGRLFIQGMNSLSARGVYTGRVLWKREFRDLGTFDVYYDGTYKDTPLNPQYNQVHIPGANARGTNLVAAVDLVYIVEGSTCHAIDPATGKDKFTIALPQADKKHPVEWGYLGVYKDVLIGGVGFANYRKQHKLSFPKELLLTGNAKGYGSKSHDRAASRGLIGFDRHTGKQLWRIDAQHSFWHNGICAGGNKIFCLDRMPQQIEKALKRRGKNAPDTYCILAIDARTGKQRWRHSGNIFGSWLSYDAESDSLLQAGARARDRSSAETGQGMAMHKASDGSVIWKKPKLSYSGPCILHDGWIITNSNPYAECAGAFRISDGSQKMVANPLTGEEQPWKMTRAYGCNNVIACENFLTFRSGAAGFYDLKTNSGTGNLGGFKSGCTSNLVVANGVLNAPDYTRTCSCAYQNQTSLALVHMPDIEVWSVNHDAAAELKDPTIRQLSLNFGAPGDRRDGDGNLWLEFPAVAGESPPLQIDFDGKPQFHRRHPNAMRPAALPWVNSSGVSGISGLTLQMRAEEAPDYKNKGLPITVAGDDAEEGTSGGVNLISSDLELVSDNEDQLVGLRFGKVPLPRGATVRSAHIQFTTDEPTEVVTNLTIRAQNTGNAPKFKSESKNISARRLTGQEVAWAPAAWKKAGEAGPLQRTTNVGPLLQSIINRDDWKPGNAVAFVIKGTGKRVARSAVSSKKPGARLLLDAETIRLKPEHPVPERPFEIEMLFALPRGETSARFQAFAEGEPVGEPVTLDQQTSVATLRCERAVGAALRMRLAVTQGQPLLTGLKLRAIDAANK